MADDGEPPAKVFCSATENIFTSAPMNSKTYMHIFTTIQQCLCNRRKDPEHGGSWMFARFMHDTMLDRFQQCCMDIRNRLVKARGVELLKRFCDEWDRFGFQAKVLSNVCKYYNQFFTNPDPQNGVDYSVDRMNIPTTQRVSLFHLGMLYFRTEVALHEDSHGLVVEAVVAAINQRRSGDKVDTTAIRKAVRCIMAIDQFDDEDGSAGLPVYNRFEEQFLLATRAYYRRKVDELLLACSLSEYLKTVGDWLEAERGCALAYLHPTSRDKLLDACFDVFVATKMDFISQEAGKVLELERAEDLRRLYTLMTTFDMEQLQIRLCDTLQSLMTTAGLDGLRAVAAEAATDCKLYVTTILPIYRHYKELVRAAFDGDARYLAAVDKACKAFVNTNAVTEQHQSSRSAELLARFCDSLLRKGAKTLEDAELEAMLADAVTLFSYLNDKDVFQKFYSQLLAKRLVGGRSVSDEAESFVISKFKMLCGSDYSSRLQRMFSDVTVSRTLNSNFTTSHPHLPVDCTFQVLTSGSWPFRQGADLHLPPVLSNVRESFTQFYTMHHQGRKLTWLWAVSKGEMVTGYLKQRFTLQVSMYQMVVLLLFNSQDSYTASDVASATGLAVAQATGVLETLVKCTLLEKQADAYVISGVFKSKKLRVDINMPIKTEVKAESTVVHHEVQKDRTIIIQAAIVRIMKARKRMVHNDLITETIAQVTHLFQPDVRHIKVQIDHLIEKEYLERVEGARNEYSYMA